MTENVCGKEADCSKRGEVRPFADVKEIGVGILGYAFMGRAHSQAYLRMPFFTYPSPARPKLIAVCGRDLKALYESVAKHGFETFCTDWKDVIRNKKVGLVDNCMPNNLHAEPCIAAAEEGIHILCEKPLAMNSRQAGEMYRAAERARVKHMTGFNYRFLPAIQLAKKFIDEGYVGRILHYRAVYLQEWIMDPDVPLVWRLRRNIGGSGAIGDQGPHIIDLARFLVGDLSSVCGMTETFIKERPLLENSSKRGKVDVDDAWIALAKFKNGAIGSFETSRLCAGRKNFMRIEVHGTEGSIFFDLERLNELGVYSRREADDRMGFRNILVTESVHPFIDYWWPTSGGNTLGWEHAFVHEVYHLLDCIVNDKSIAPIGATFYDGMRCQQVVDAITESAEKQRWVTVPS